MLWDKSTEQKFRQWFTAFAKVKGWPQNPDHDRHSDIDWRAAWWAGARQMTEEVTKTTGAPVPTEKVKVFQRSEHKPGLVVARR